MKTYRRNLFGILLITAGTLFLLDNLELIPGVPPQLFTWYTLFLLIALFSLLSGHRVAALIFATLGGFFYLDDMYGVDMENLWPVILIIIGLGILFRQRSHKRRVVATNENLFDDLNVFGSSEKNFVSDQLEGGKITNVFGGSTIDLRESRIQAGATVEVFLLFGGCEIVVPPDWNVKIDVVSIFGGFSDSRAVSSQDRSAAQLTIRGMTLFGGGELKSRKPAS